MTPVLFFLLWGILPVGMAVAHADDDASQAETAYFDGQYATAVQYWQLAEASASSTEKQLAARLGIAQSYRHLGRYNYALQALIDAHTLATSSASISQQISLYNEYSKLFTAMSDQSLKQLYQNHRHMIQKAISQIADISDTDILSSQKLAFDALDRASGLSFTNEIDPILNANVLNQKGNLLSIQFRYEDALNAYQQALAGLGQTPDEREQAGKILINQLRTRQLLDQENSYNYESVTEAFAPTYQNIQTAAKALQGKWRERYTQALGLIALSQEAITLGHSLNEKTEELQSLALNSLLKAKQLADELQNPHAQAYTYGYLGAIHESKGQLETALRFTRQAQFFAQKTRSRQQMYQWLWQTGRILRAQGQTMQALEAYEQATNHFQPVRNQSATTGYCQHLGALRTRISPIYFEKADLLLALADQEESASRQQQLLQRARKSIESFKNIELQNYYRDPCITSQAQCQVDVTEQQLKNLLTDQVALLYPMLFDQRLVLLLQTKQGLQQFIVPVTNLQVRETVALLLTDLHRHPDPLSRSRNTSKELFSTTQCSPGKLAAIPLDIVPEDYLPAAQQLYDWLIKPINDVLREQKTISTLVIVPDGALRTMPFAVLHDGQHFLIEQYALSTLPNLCLQPAIEQSKHTSILLAGISESVEGTLPLPCTAYEIKELQKLYHPEQAPLLNQAFRLDNLQSEISQRHYNIIHIASHGQFRPNLEDTYILTYDGHLQLERLQELMQLTTLQKRPVDLLTLSACETAVGNDQAALGLAGMALRAGVRSALASLWRVDDEATSEITLAFYRTLQTLKDSTASKAKALQKAQQLLLNDTRFIRYRHPYYWSAFMLIGHW